MTPRTLTPSQVSHIAEKYPHLQLFVEPYRRAEPSEVPKLSQETKAKLIMVAVEGTGR